MQVGWLMPVLAVLATVSAAQGAAELPGGSAPAAEATVVVPEGADELQTVGEIEAAYAAGNYDQAIEAASTFLRNAKDGGFKARAARVVADALRKKKDWKRAAAAYLMLRDRFPKGSDEYIRYHTMADILRASPTGVYGQTAGEDGEANPNAGPSLDNDAALAAAMAKLAERRADKVRVRVSQIPGARTAQEVIQRFGAVAMELRHLHILWPAMPPDLEREAAQAAGMRMARIGGQVVAGLKSKQAAFDAVRKTNRLTRGLQREMQRCQRVSHEMAKAEGSLAAGMEMLPGMSGWPEGEQLKADSAARRQTFEELAKAFEPPKMRGRNDRADWRDFGLRGRGGAAGAGRSP